MKLKYVGAYPIVTHKGVSFDQTKPDPYIYLNAIIEIIEAIEKSTDKNIQIDEHSLKDYNANELMDFVKKYCSDFESMIKQKEARVDEIVQNYTNASKNNPNLNADEKKAILGNIDIMKDYYKSYITNDIIYKCLLEVLSDIVVKKHIKDITFSIGRNYGMVLSDVARVLQDHKPYRDATMEFFSDDSGIAYGKLDMNIA